MSVITYCRVYAGLDHSHSVSDLIVPGKDASLIGIQIVEIPTREVNDVVVGRINFQILGVKALHTVHAQRYAIIRVCSQHPVVGLTSPPERRYHLRLCVDHVQCILDARDAHVVRPREVAC